MNKNGKSEPHKKGTIAMRDATMMLLVRRMLNDAVAFCAFEKVTKPVTVENWRR
jgi:DNA polymerase III alpha subunit (gram-positive type)